MPETSTVPCLAEPHRKPPRHAPSGRGTEVRAAAARVVYAVRSDGRSLTDALQDATAGFDARDGALLQALCFGTLRQLPRLRAVAARLLTRPLQRGDRILEDLIAVGLYQLTSLRTPEHAAIAATVGAARSLGRPRASGLVNATLRRFQRERSALLAGLDEDPAVRWLFPIWLLERLRQSWPEHWQTIIAASNEQAPMTLRVNRRRGDTHSYAQMLAENGLLARPIPGFTEALTLDQPLPARALPGFADGLVSIQDASAQLAAVLLDAQAGDRVLDACAAPGGKTAHILERVPAAGNAEVNLDVTAVDIDPARLETLRSNLERLGLQARVFAADAANANSDWPGAPYHRILLDAPCSATGVIRRHPDIKWLRRDSDIATLQQTQADMLEALWPLLLPGGRLLYATCSVLPEENDAQVRAFLAAHEDASERSIEAAWGLPRQPGRQLLPAQGGGDGFYYALLEKAS
ncbi:MAG: 16S rRNA (cytosine(967)-C(5))-methyltransferase RsmB [Thiohalocapsa sp.]